MYIGPSLSAKIGGRNNNFDFLRFFAASQVILYHTFALSGNYSGTFWDAYELVCKDSGLGVDIFFIISGFLIMKSRLDTPDLFVYLKKRFLRLMPALIIAVLFCVVIIGPLASSLEPASYFSQLLAFNHHLPKVFENNYRPHMVNGSLWTLKVEAFAYLVIAVVGFMRVAAIRYFLAILFVLLFAVDMAFLGSPEYSKLMVGTIYANLSFRCLTFFIAGSLVYLYRDRVILNGYLFLVVLLIAILMQQTSYSQAVSYFTLAYMVVYFAYSDLPLHNFGRFGDFSYGLYIYAFPVQQTLQHFWGHGLNNVAFFILAFTITYILAALSWYVIEKPMLRLKDVRILPGWLINAYNASRR